MTTAIQPDPDALPDAEVLAHLGYLLACAHEVPDVPEFGSPAWLALDPRDPRRHAGLVLAAWAWWGARHDLAAPVASDRLHRHHRRDLDVALDTEPAAATYDRALRAAVARHQQRLHDAHQPRPHDHPGGPAPSWGPDLGRPAA